MSNGSNEKLENITCPKTSNTNPVKAIRLKCLDCCAGSSQEVDKCSARQCSIWPFRKGKNPFRTKRELTDEERAEMAERLKKARENKK